MSIEGEIRVRLLWDGRRVQRVTVRSTRPTAAARIALGRRPAEAATMLPTLFAVCGHAQAAAAAAALCAAGARPDGMPHINVWSVPLEAVQDTFWRLLIDAPRALGLAAQTGVVAAARALVAEALAALRSDAEPTKTLENAAIALAELARDHVHGREPAAWLAETDLAAFDAWRDAEATLPARALARLVQSAPGLGRSDTALMPGLDDDGWWSAVVPALRRDAAFAQAPTWAGMPVETGALSRTRTQPLVAALIARDGHSAATRIAARVVELSQLLQALREGAADPSAWLRSWSLDRGVGLAAVQTARGLLLHCARVGDDRVDDYRIVAPTEWNFHPEGALARGLIGTEADDEATLAARAGVAVLALDPCVGFAVEVTRHA